MAKKYKEELFLNVILFFIIKQSITPFICLYNLLPSDIANNVIFSYSPLSRLYPNQGVFTPVNSCLSEYGVLGFEFGYSQTNPNVLCIWEAQFGDFQNTAQCMFDCFISNSEHKWYKQSGLVMNLPHGLEGKLMCNGQFYNIRLRLLVKRNGL